MTVDATTPRVQHVTNGIQDTFAFAFRVIEGDDIEVFLNDSFVPESPATYTVNLSVGPPPGQNGGDVVMNVPPAAGTLTIQRRTDRTQETDYVPFDAFPAETHETALDKAMMTAQEAFDLQSRVFLAAPGYDPTTALIIPNYEEGKFLKWSVLADDGLPNRLINSTFDEDALEQAVLDAQAAAAAAAASAAAAATSAANAATSEANAAASAASAAADAASASTSAANAAASAASAAADAAAASTSAANAAASAAAAAADAASASADAAAAAASAAAAATSASNAATSETNAANSAANAATSETNAAASAAAALASETAAAASAAAAAASAAVAAFFDVSTYVAAPTANGVTRHIMTRSATYDFNGIAGTGYADVAPSGNTIFTIDKVTALGVVTNLATMTFPNGVNDGTWADVAGSDQTLAATDRIEITAPATLNGISEVAITVPLLLP